MPRGSHIRCQGPAAQGFDRQGFVIVWATQRTVMLTGFDGIGSPPERKIAWIDPDETVKYSGSR